MSHGSREKGGVMGIWLKFAQGSNSHGHRIEEHDGTHHQVLLLSFHQSPTLGAHAHVHGFWVGMGAMLLFMDGHGWASVLSIPASNSKSESNFSDARNTIIKKRSGLKPTTFVRPNQDLV
jgi:hypothetical protein